MGTITKPVEKPGIEGLVRRIEALVGDPAAAVRSAQNIRSYEIAWDTEYNDPIGALMISMQHLDLGFSGDLVRRRGIPTEQIVASAIKVIIEAAEHRKDFYEVVPEIADRYIDMIGGDRYANVVQIVNRLVAGHYLYRDEDEEIRKELMAGVDGLDETHRQWEAEIALEDHEEERKEIKEDALAELEAILAKMEKNIAGVRPLLRD